MKGRIGGTATVESPMKGVVAPTPTPPRTLGSNVIAAVKRRKRGGAVADSGGKVEGKMAMARLDKPKRARGGGVDDVAKQISAAATLKPIPNPGGYKTGEIMNSKVHGNAAKRATERDAADAAKSKRARGGKVGADTKPLTSANREKPARGHSTGGNLD